MSILYSLFYKLECKIKFEFQYIAFFAGEGEFRGVGISQKGAEFYRKPAALYFSTKIIFKM